jgi:hypothetical protein
VPGGEALTTLQLRLPERVLAWQGRMRLAFGLRVQDGSGVRPESVQAAAGPVEPKGWFDSLLGARTPLAAGDLALDEAAEVVTSHGWMLDAALWRGPDSVEMVLEPEAEGVAPLRFAAELYPRPDIPRGFRRPVQGLTGCRCRLPLAALPPGRYPRIAWEARFGARPPARVVAPYALTVTVEEATRRRHLSVEITGRLRYA